MKTLILLCLPYLVLLDPYYACCTESTDRTCPNDENQTDYLQNMKKGGSDILSTNDYMYDFMLCEEYNHDCGYLETLNNYVTLSNGVELDFDATKLDEIFGGASSTLKDKIAPYLQAYGDQAICGMKLFPLTLTSTESVEFLDNFMGNLATSVETLYNTNKVSGNPDWMSININIRTAVLYEIKKNETLLGNSVMWTCLLQNDFAGVS